MYKRLYKFLNDNNILSELQLVVDRTYSTTHALINLTEKKALDEGKIGCGIFVDLHKAFDIVEPEILLSKLDHYSVCRLTNSWFKSYFTDRKHYLSINCYNSSLSFIAYGVPRGSPSVFAIYK